MIVEMIGNAEETHSDIFAKKHPKFPGNIPERRVGNLNRRFVQSAIEILTILSVVCSFCGMVSAEIFKYDYKRGPDGYFYLWNTHSKFVYHEFCMIASWISLSIFLAVCAFSLDKWLKVLPITMLTAIMIQSIFWMILILISSCYAASIGFIYNMPVSALDFSAVFGFLQVFALLGMVICTCVPSVIDSSSSFL